MHRIQMHEFDASDVDLTYVCINSRCAAAVLLDVYSLRAYNKLSNNNLDSKLHQLMIRSNEGLLPTMSGGLVVHCMSHFASGMSQRGECTHYSM